MRGFMRLRLQQLHRDAIAKTKLLADLYIRINKLEGEVDKKRYVAERLRTVMNESAEEERKRGEELVQLEDDLRLERKGTRRGHNSARTGAQSVRQG